MNSMNDVKVAMSTLYEELRAGRTDLKMASELANIAGKYLKAEQLQLAREIFLADKRVEPAPIARPVEKMTGALGTR